MTAFRTNKKYEGKGYQVIFVLYPDKSLYGNLPRLDDRIIYTDIKFIEASGIDENGRKKKVFEGV